MLLSTVVSLYTSRVVLQTLGVEDYGIYGVVGGVVAMFSFLNSSMAGATSRFLTFEMGKGDKERLKATFSSALIIHIGIALLVLILAETIGVWFLNNKLVIPEGRMEAAHWVLQFSVLGMIVGFTQVPYNAAIIAHEKMDVYAYVELIHVFLKLGIVYLLWIGNFDKLILYAFLTLVVNVIVAMIYRIYCIRHYEESKFKWMWDKKIMRPMFSFCVYDIFGNMCYTVRIQGTNFLLNIFFGTIINAANSIATTIQGTLLSLSSSVTTAFKPQIIKNYASEDYNKFNYYINFGAKVSSCLLLVITIPLLLNLHQVLLFWLGEIPEGVVVICRILLIMNIFSINSQLIVIGIHASGKVKYLGLYCGWLYLLSLPLMYVLLKLGAGYNVIYLVVACITFMYLVFSLLILRYFVRNFNLLNFIFKTLFPQLLIGITSYTICYIIFHKILSIPYTILFDFLSSCIIILSLVFISLNKSSKEEIYKYIKSYVTKFTS